MTITVQLQGGLGNQLFQYASAKHFAMRLSKPLLLDDIWFTEHHEDTTPRTLSLPYLKVPIAISRSKEWVVRPRKSRMRLQAVLPLNPYYILESQPFTFDPHRFSLSPVFGRDYYLMGYWQSFRYFEGIRHVLVNELVPQKPLRSYYQAVLQNIQGSSASCMIHVRRGDYVHLAQANHVHGVLTLDYYRRAIEHMQKRTSHMQFFVFSDDIAWVKAHLLVPGEVQFIEGGRDDLAAVEELYLMTQCQNHIIANSSLSWWGAWLCNAKEQEVICPNQWLRVPNKNNFMDLLPSTWQRLAN
jgi:hypothetical protein